MADVKDPKKDTASGIQQNLIAGKYKTQDELVNAYKELEGKLTQMGESKKQTDAHLQQIAAQAQQAAQQVQQMAPYAQWSQQYGPAIYQWIQQMQQYEQNRQWAEVNQNPQFSILTPQEKAQLFQEYQAEYQQKVFQPWLQNYVNQTALPYINQQLQAQQHQFNSQLKAATEVLWHSIEGVAPKEALEKVKRHQETLLKYANGRTYDPNKFAQDELAREMELMKATDRAQELERQLQAYTNAGAPAAGGSGLSPFKKSEDRPEKSDNKYERAKQIFSQVKEKVGADTFREGMPGGAS